MTYDPANIFARILRGEIPCDKVYEDDHVLAFRDLHPQATVHVLVVPKGAYVDQADFGANASDAELAAFARALARIAAEEGDGRGWFSYHRQYRTRMAVRTCRISTCPHPRRRETWPHAGGLKNRWPSDFVSAKRTVFPYIADR